jgi:hypothetical protein
MLDAPGNNEHLSGAKGHCPVSHLNLQGALEDEKEVVCFLVFVPDELALGLDDHDIKIVDLGDCAR